MDKPQKSLDTRRSKRLLVLVNRACLFRKFRLYRRVQGKYRNMQRRTELRIEACQLSLGVEFSCGVIFIFTDLIYSFACLKSQTGISTSATTAL